MSLAKKHRAVLRYTTKNAMKVLAKTDQNTVWSDAYLDFNLDAPLYVLPADPASYAAQIEAMARAHWNRGTKKDWWAIADESQKGPAREAMQTGLTALGITPPRPATKERRERT